jgi:hypothetical protein
MTKSEMFLWWNYTYAQMTEWKRERERLREREQNV